MPWQALHEVYLQGVKAKDRLGYLGVHGKVTGIGCECVDETGVVRVGVQWRAFLSIMNLRVIYDGDSHGVGAVDTTWEEVCRFQN